jgi:adenosylcobyric acid synthase
LFRITDEQGRAVDRYDGCISDDGQVWGTYIQGLFEELQFRREFLNHLRARRSWEPLLPQVVPSKQETLDALADLVSLHLDCAMLHEIVSGQIQIPMQPCWWPIQTITVETEDWWAR